MWNGMHANAAHDYSVSLAKKEKKKNVSFLLTRFTTVY